METRRACGMDGELLQEYLDGATGRIERREVESHLSGCPVCAAEVEGYRRLCYRLSSLPLFAPGVGFDHAVLSAVLPRRVRVLGLSPAAWFASASALSTLGLLAVSMVLAGTVPVSLEERLRPLTRLWHDALHLALKGLHQAEPALHLARHLVGVLGVLLAQVAAAPRLLSLAWATPEGRFYVALSACTALAFFLLARRSPKGGPIVSAAF